MALETLDGRVMKLKGEVDHLELKMDNGFAELRGMISKLRPKRRKRRKVAKKPRNKGTASSGV